MAIASSLNVDSRVFTQGVRNLNDGIALLNVAEGSLSELRNIVFRLRELAEQSANGVLTSVQRQSIDAEGQALVSEYSRIIAVTDFNGLKLLDGTLENLRLQAGYGTTGELTVAIGQQVQRNLAVPGTTTSIIGNGSFQAGVSYSSGASVYSVALVDINGDSKLDAITADRGANKISVLLGNGNGTFQARVSYTTGTAPRAMVLGDVNGDGKLDVVTADEVSAKVGILLGNGNGTFQARLSYSTDSNPQSVFLGDVNGDGKLDVVTADYLSSGDKISVFLGNGNGTFQARTSYDFITSNNPKAAILGDFNGDGKLDIVASGANALKVFLFLGNGNGTFKANTSYSSTWAPRSLAAADLDGDGKLDLVAADYNTTFSVLLGNGNGSFKAKTAYSTGNFSHAPTIRDLNGDGKLDVVISEGGSNTISVFLGNGNGSFKARTSYPSGSGVVTPYWVAVGDVDGNGSVDIASAALNNAKIFIFSGNTTSTAVATSTPISFLTQSSSLSAITTLATIQTSIENELANIGSYQSRIGTAVSNLQQTRENYNAAESRIVDADTAEETATLLKNQIRQQTASAVLAQANQEPGLLLRLISNV